MRPDGMARVRVRVMTASMSRSYHMLSAPAAPAPTAMASSATKPKGAPEMLRASDEPMMPSGALSMTSASCVKFWSWNITIASMTKIMSGATEAMAELALADSSTAPPISIR